MDIINKYRFKENRWEVVLIGMDVKNIDPTKH